MTEIKEPDVAQKIEEALADHLKVERKRVTSGALLRNDLGLDSVDTIELLFHLEEGFNIRIPDEDLQKLRTVGDLTAYIQARLQPSKESTSEPTVVVKTPKAGREKTKSRRPRRA